MLSMDQSQRGFTFLELLITVAIIGVLAALAGPYMGDYVERQRWVGATEAIYGELQQAKRASISNNTQIYFKVTSSASANWCAGYGDGAGCDCAVANSCQINGQNTLQVSADDYPGISVLDKSVPGASTIDGSFIMPGVSAASKTVVIRSSSLGDVEVDITAAGRISVCSDDLSQYPDC